ncbi:MAG TPA: penicillin acylase family protein, partial [Spirochaetota bacterium]|nr:penicillin acylase family protein [Spirochaetota bacterium]
DNKNAQILKDWDFVYRADSIAPTVFENIYRAILLKVFGDYGLGREVVNYLLDETSMFNDYFGNFDNIIFNKKSSWFKNGTREDVLKMAVDEGLKAKAVPYGRTRKIYFKNLLFGDKVPSFFGLDFGPVELPGNRATVTQGQIFRSGGRLTTFSPSCRIIADMSDTLLLTNTTGGNCDRPFTRWYKNNMEGWLNSEYKLLI